MTDAIDADLSDPHLDARAALTAAQLGDDVRPVPGYDGWYASRDGRIFTEWNHGGRGQRVKTGVLREVRGANADGYRCVMISRRPARNVFVHKMVLLAFVGPCPPGMQCRHLNDLPWDNRVENLVWGTQSQNSNDIVERRRKNEPDRFFSDTEVIEIRERCALGESASALARVFGVSTGHIWLIHTGQIWKNIGGPITPKRSVRAR